MDATYNGNFASISYYLSYFGSAHPVELPKMNKTYRSSLTMGDDIRDYFLWTGWDVYCYWVHLLYMGVDDGFDSGLRTRAKLVLGLTFVMQKSAKY